MAVNFIQMPLCLRKNINEKSSAYGKYYVEVDNAETLTTEGLVQHIRNHNCAVGEEAIAAVLKKLGECVPELVAQGQPVKIDGLGIFRATASSAGADEADAKRKDFQLASLLKGIRMRFLPQSDSFKNLTSKRFLEERVAPSVRYVVASESRTVAGEERTVQVRTTIEDFRNPADGD